MACIAVRTCPTGQAKGLLKSSTTSNSGVPRRPACIVAAGSGPLRNKGQERRRAQPALAPTTASQPPPPPAAAVSHLATSSVVDVGTVGEVAQQELKHLL